MSIRRNWRRRVTRERTCHSEVMMCTAQLLMPLVRHAGKQSVAVVTSALYYKKFLKRSTMTRKKTSRPTTSQSQERPTFPTFSQQVRHTSESEPDMRQLHSATFN